MITVSRIEDVPDFDAMSAEEVVAWFETHELTYELDRQLFPDEDGDLEADLKAVGLEPKIILQP